MRAADLFHQYRKHITPPYTHKDLITILATIIILLGLPATIIAILTARGFGVPAKEPLPEFFVFTRELFDKSGTLIASEEKKIQLSGKPEFFINGVLESELTSPSDKVIVDSRPERDLLKNYIVELSTKNLGRRNQELKKNKVKQADTVKELKALKKTIAGEHASFKSDLAKTLNKKLTEGNPAKGQRKAFRDLDTTFNGLLVELLPNEVEKVKKIKGVRRVVEDTIVKATLDSSVPMIHANEAWPFVDSVGAPLTGYGVKIGIIDTGVDYTHADLGGCFGPGCKVEGGWDFINNDSNPMDDHGHGTHVAATAGGRGIAAGNPLLGVAPDATIYAYKVLSSGGSGATSGVAAAIDRCVDPNLDGDFTDHLDVCSMSLGGSGNPDDITSLASDNAMRNGVVITIAAGNSGPSYQTITSPGTSREAITVGAACKPADIGKILQCSTDIASFSSRGPVKWTGTNGEQQEMVKPDIVAPGVNICAAEWNSWLTTRRCKDTTHIAISGTSMATPHVAGMAALLRQAVPNAAPANIKNAIKLSAVPYSGFDENTQGKGLIHTVEALKILSPNLDFSAKLSSTPFAWTQTADISGSTFTKTQTFTIKNNTTDSTTAAISAQNVPSGLSITTDKSSISMPANGTATFIATLTGNNSVLVSGKTYIASLLVDSPVKQLSVAVLVNVPKRISTTQSVDFGIDPPDFAGTWTSTKPFQLTNLQSVSGTYNLTVSCCVGPNGNVSSGIGIALSQSSVSLPPDGSQSVSATASVNNSTIPNGTYSGNIIVSSSLQEPIYIPFTITKFYRLVITYPADNKPTIVAFHDQKSLNKSWPVGSIDSVTFLLDSKPSVLDVVGYKSVTTGTEQGVKWVVKENVPFDGDHTEFIDLATATVKYQTSYTGINGENLSRMYRQDPSLKFKNNGAPNISLGFTNFEPLTFYFNQLSSNYVFSVAAIQKYSPSTSTEVRKAVLFEHVDQDGITANRTLSNTVSALKLVPAFGYPGTNDDTILFDLHTCTTGVFGVTSCNTMGSTNLEMLKVNNYRYDLYTLPIENAAEVASVIVFERPFLFGTDVSTLAYGPQVLFDKDGLIRWGSPSMSLGGAKPTLLSSTDANRLDVGVLPFHFNVNWIVSPSFTYIGSRASSEFLYLGQEWTTSRFSGASSVRRLNYRVFKDGNKVAEGVTGTTVNLTNAIGANPGNYEIEIFDNVPINGTNSFHSYKGIFTIPSGFTSSMDREPPTTTSFDFLSDGIPAQVVDPARSHLLRFGLDPLPAVFGTDSISSLDVKLKTNVSNEQSLTVTKNSTTGEYSANVPVITNADLYTFTITAIDNYANKLVYSFQLPKGTVIDTGGPGPDLQPPTVNVTSPADGASVSGTVNVTASATDNVGVSKAEFYVDNALKSTDTSSPYSYSWNTTTVANGSHSLLVKAYDAAGNVGSDEIAVTVANGDTKPPSTPTNLTANAPSYNRVDLTWTASADNVGVVGYWIVRNGVTIAQAGAVTSFSDTIVSASTTYSYNVAAFDAAGNTSGPSNTATVTTPAVPDTQAPTAPTNLSATTVSTSQINLAWNASTDNIGVTGYEVYRNSIKVATVTTTSFGDTGLSASTSYSYFVKARDAAGNVSAASNTVTAVTLSVGDSDGDGFSDDIEQYVGTNPFRACPRNLKDSSWPPDFNNDKKVDFADLNSFGSHLFSKLGQPAYSNRYDLNADGIINIGDVIVFGQYYGKNCR